MACRHKHPHYHRYTDIVTTMYCRSCGVATVDVWMKCDDNTVVMCDDCYWEDETLRYYPTEEEKQKEK